MEIQNTLENKAKFFAQYWGQRILAATLNDNDFRQKLGNTYMGKYHVEMCHIELKPLSSITDEDAKKIGFRDSDHFKFDASPTNWKDELRLLGYAVEWVNLSVEKQLEYGWIKLKND